LRFNVVCYNVMGCFDMCLPGLAVVCISFNYYHCTC